MTRRRAEEPRRPPEELLTLFRRRHLHEVPPDPAGPPATLEIVGDELLCTSPEGRRHVLPLARLCEGLEPYRNPPPDVVWPSGTRAVRAFRNAFVVAHETPPGVHHVRWSSGPGVPDSGQRFTYRDVRLALPYVLVVTGMRFDASHHVSLCSFTEVYFANRALSSASDPLHYAPLLNVTRTSRDDVGGGSVVCLNGIRLPQGRETDPSRRLDRALSAVVEHLLRSGFNEDFERTGRRSTFNDPGAKPPDPRLATIDAWEQATERDPSFILDVDWVPTGRSLEHALRAVTEDVGHRPPGPVRNATIQRLAVTLGHTQTETTP